MFKEERVGMSCGASESSIEESVGLEDTLDLLHKITASMVTNGKAETDSAWHEALEACRRFAGAREIVIAIRGGMTRRSGSAAERSSTVETAKTLPAESSVVVKRTLARSVDATVSFRFSSPLRREAAEREGRVDALLMHLDRLLLLHGVLERTRHEQLFTRSLVDRLSIGICLLERERHVVFANDSARALLRSSPIAALDDDERLHCTDQTSQPSLDRVIADACGGASSLDPVTRLTLRSTDVFDPSSLIIEVEPYPSDTPHGPAGHALVTLIDPKAACEPCLGRLSSLYSLSTAESDVLYLMVAGHTNRQIADIRHVGSETIRTQVTSVLRKLGIARRSELFRLVSATSPIRLTEPSPDEPAVRRILPRPYRRSIPGNSTRQTPALTRCP